MLTRYMSTAGVSLKSRMVIGGFLLAFTSSLWAQDLSTAITISIERQPLGQALATLAEQTGLQIIVAEDDVRNFTGEALQGSYSASQVLDILLENTGLEYSVVGENTIIVRDNATPGEAAQDSAPPLASATQPQNLNEVIITAQRREQRLQDVPISVSVATGEILQRDGLRTLEDVAARLPSVNISQVPGSDAITIRGVGSGNDLGFEQSVATFVDGVYRSRSRASRIAFFDVDRIEVLRGPQTTFFGNNAIAGALNITTRKPGDEFEANLAALYSPSDQEYNLEGGVSMPVTDDFALRVSGRVSGMDGYIKNHLLDDYGPELDNKIGRVSFRWTPTDILEFDGRIDVARIRDESIYNSEVLNCPPDAVFGAPAGACNRYLVSQGGEVDDSLDHRTVNGPSYFDMDMLEASLHSAINLDEHRIVAITGFYDHDYSTLSTVLPTRNASVVNSSYGLPTRGDEDFQQFSQELRWETTGERKVDLMAGAYYSRSRATILSGQGYFFAPFGMFAPGFQPADPIGIFTVNKPEDEVMSVFGAATVHFRPDLRLNLGLRYSDVEKKTSRVNSIGVSEDTMDYGLFVPGPAAGQAVLRQILGIAAGDFDEPKRSDDEWMPSLTLEHNLGEDTMVYASYTHGFKAGGFAVGLLKNTFDPETVDAYEIGLKSSHFDNRLTLNLAAFHSTYSDLQASSFIILPSGAPVGIIGNVAESESKGLELSGSLGMTPSLLLTFDLAYLDSRYESYPLGPCTQLGARLTPNCVQDLAGKRRAFSPEFSGNIGLSHSSPLTDTLELRLNTNLIFTSEYYLQANAEPMSTQSGYAKLDARIAVGTLDGKWEVAVIGKNLNDRTTASYWSPLPSSPGSAQGLADRPRSIALQLLMNF